MKYLVILNDPPYGTERSYNGQWRSYMSFQATDHVWFQVRFSFVGGHGPHWATGE